ncbi:MAG: hypothetical protein ACRELF_11385, partial [Gemmataceae bacterium]
GYAHTVGETGRSGRTAIVGAEFDVVAAPFARGFVPLPLLFGSAAKTHEENEKRHKRKRE